MAIEMAQHRAGLYVPCYGVFGVGRPRPALRGQRGAEAALPLSDAARREARLLRPHRALGRQRSRARHPDPRRARTATTGSSTAPRCSSRAPTRPTSASCSPAPTPTRAAAASPASSSTPTCRASTCAASCTRCAPRTTPPSCSSRTCACPHANVLGEVNKGFAIANDRLSRQRIPYAAACIGVAVKAQELAIDYAKQRETFGAPLATRQAVQWMIVDNEIDIRTSLWLTLAAAAQGRPRPALPHGGRHGQAGRQRGRRPGGRPLHADPRRLRHDQGPAASSAGIARCASAASARAPTRCSATSSPAICWARACGRSPGCTKPWLPSLQHRGKPVEPRQRGCGRPSTGSGRRWCAR